MANRYWINGSGGNFNDTANWSTSSGGSGGASVPSISDVAIFDKAGTFTVTFPNTSFSVGGFSHTTGNVTFSGGTSCSLLMYGAFSIASTATWNLIGTPPNGLGFLSSTTSITTNGVTLNGNVTFGNLGSWTLTGNLTVGSDYTLTLASGTLYMNGYNISCGKFSANPPNTTAKTLDFGTSGTNKVTLTGTGTVWNTPSLTNFTVAPDGTFYAKVVNVSPTVSGTVTIDTGSVSETQALDWYFVSMPSSSTVTFTSGNAARVLQFDSASATCTVSNVALSISGSMRVQSANFAFSSGSNAWTYLTGSGLSGAVTSQSSVTLDFPMTINGARNWTFTNVVMGSTRTLTHQSGDIYGSLSTGAYATSGTAAKTLGFTTLTLTGSGTVFTNTSSNNLTVTTTTIACTSASAKTFNGGGLSYPVTLTNNGAGALTIDGGNTFTTLANGVQPTAFTFTSGTTTTVTNWSISGTAGNLVTIGSTSSGQHTLSKASGSVNATYLSISSSNATGGATWTAGAGSVNGGNNTGWLFPFASTGNFLFLFQ